MAAIVEIKYFNSFLLKKTVSWDDGIQGDIPKWNGSTGVPEGTNGSYPVLDSGNLNQGSSWFIEESRIRGGYNNTNIDYGVRAYLVDENPNAKHRTNSLIYSGIFNSRTGVNQSNVFNVGEDITKSADPANGSIQRLYAEDSNLILFQENKVSRALIDKDAIYSAEGGGSVTTTRNVIGEIVPYAGNFGISTNPESFAVYGYRKYFVDANRNAVMRLSRDGMTEISNYGMIDYFRDELGALNGGKAIGAYDIYTKQYVLSLQRDDVENNYQTLAFDETINGWTSRFTYSPDQVFSIKNKYYSIKNEKLYQHNYLPSQGNNRGVFYGEYNKSSVTFVFNPNVSMSKSFKTVNYEGSSGWEINDFKGQVEYELSDVAKKIYSYDEGSYTENGVKYYVGFNNREGKYKADIIQNRVEDKFGQPYEEETVVLAQNTSGVKGYYATVTISTDDSTEVNSNGGKPRELFAVSSEYNESSY